MLRSDERRGRKKKLCFYTCFFGPNGLDCDVINTIPSRKYDCFYLTNNTQTYERLQSTEWISVFLPIPIKENNNLNAFDSKFFKACPHLIKELENYEYTVYIDSKSVLVNESLLIQLINKYSHAPILMIPHRWWPCIHKAVIFEFSQSLQQDRYVQEKQKILDYINNKIEKGYSLSLPMHYETGFIVRKNHHDLIIKLNEAWYREIVQCGIQCQISFFFVQQMFPNTVQSLTYPLDPLIVSDPSSLNKKITRKMKDGFCFWHVTDP